jgi:hypothetical protein
MSGAGNDERQVRVLRMRVVLCMRAVLCNGVVSRKPERDTADVDVGCENFDLGVEWH